MNVLSRILALCSVIPALYAAPNQSALPYTYKIKSSDGWFYLVGVCHSLAYKEIPSPVRAYVQTSAPAFMDECSLHEYFTGVGLRENALEQAFTASATQCDYQCELSAWKSKKVIIGLESFSKHTQQYTHQPSTWDGAQEFLKTYGSIPADAVMRTWYTQGTVEENAQKYPALFACVNAYKARNMQWIPQLTDSAKKYPGYIALVGAGHLYGPHSLLDMLKNTGYSVERVKTIS